MRRTSVLPGLLLATCAMAIAAPATARTLHARIDRVDATVAQLHGVDATLAWPAAATHGELLLHAARVQAPDLGYDFRDVTWQCTLQRDGNGRWHCDGGVRTGNGAPMRLAVDLGPDRTTGILSRGDARIAIERRAAAPDLTAIDITAVPVAWAQALLAQAWAAPQLQDGRLDAQLQVQAGGGGPVQVEGLLAFADVGFDTPDGTIAGLGLGGRFALDYRKAGTQTAVQVDGTLSGGEFLVGKAYVALDGPVAVEVQARGSEGEGWQVPRFAWRDPGVLLAEGSAAFGADASLDALDLQLHSEDASPLAGRYLSGWLGLAGLADLSIEGAIDADVRIAGGALRSGSLQLHGVDLRDPQGRFRFDALAGNVDFTGGDTVETSELAWAGGALYGLDFGAARLPLESSAGTLRLREAVDVAVLGGNLRLEHLAIAPPGAGESLSLRFGLAVENLDVGRLSEAVGWPAFRGTLSGRFPEARYADDRLEFDGDLVMDVFGGNVRVSSLAMERPFGSAPTLTADLRIDDIEMLALTEVLEFGSISGRLDGRILDLRLVDWHPVAFDAKLLTDPKRGVPQRISQRAVQNISSVGDASFANSLQGRLIGLFDDFGYSRIGISCRLRNEVCEMGGLRSGSNTFTIVAGAGLPRLTVIGHNRLVDWPVLVERLAAVAGGDVKPVID
ncbi:MAG TPA: hypothetical protein VFS99_01175 [Xanthomonadaceae bacterium]|nr:hypothetical protein [Xanthomonadaceae bacterium]